MTAIFELTAVVLAALLSENFVLVTCMGIGTHVQSFRDPKEALRTGHCLTAVMVLSTLCAWVLNRFILLPNRWDFFRLFFLALLIPAIVFVLRRFLAFCVPELSRRVDDNLSSISTNCAALGCALLITQRSYGLTSALLFSLFGGIGATIALGSFASLLQEADLEHCPRSFRGFPIKFITAGLMAMALIGFYGLHLG